MSERKPQDMVQLKVRMREPMRAEIERAAKEVGHSMNAEIIKRLEASQRANGAEGYFLDVFMTESASQMDDLRKRMAQMEEDISTVARRVAYESKSRRRGAAAAVLTRDIDPRLIGRK